MNVFWLLVRADSEKVPPAPSPESQVLSSLRDKSRRYKWQHVDLSRRQQ
ncbi:hypothetical protein L579_4457 [Pantoea sp. AS-PWVM4]|nr:hypothetical protein L579_4457 [Pantoea sp. AS-PWVM4]